MLGAATRPSSVEALDAFLILLLINGDGPGNVTLEGLLEGNMAGCSSTGVIGYGGATPGVFGTKISALRLSGMNGFVLGVLFPGMLSALALTLISRRLPSKFQNGLLFAALKNCCGDDGCPSSCCCPGTSSVVVRSRTLSCER